MPGNNRAELSAELRIEPSSRDEKGPREQVEAGMQAASDTGLAHEAGPGSTVLAGRRKEVLDAVMKVAEAALDAGARAVQVKLEAQGDAGRFGGPGGRRSPR